MTILNNSASNDGGGIYCNNSDPNLKNVTISGNIVGSRGGGIYCYRSDPSLENITITGNTAVYGGGIDCAFNSNPSLVNCILWNDSPSEICFQEYTDDNSITISYSDIQCGLSGVVTNNNGIVNWLEGNIDEDPLFVNPQLSDYHLTENSPCIDAGVPGALYDPDGTIKDMGAFYYHQIVVPDPPQNVTIEIIGSDVHLSWNAVTGANSYKVYSSDDPYTGFVEDTSGSLDGESWSASIGSAKKFYHVKAFNN